MTGRPLIYIVAGEASGDALGARLISALKAETDGAVSFAGIGGPEMQAAGLRSLFPMQELSVMGLVEVIPHLRRILGRMRQAADDISSRKPDAVVTIDSPGFTRGLVKRIKRRDFPCIHYVAPTVWAWRPNRVHKFKNSFDHLLALLPFEPPYFEAAGLPCTFVGHSVLESGADNGDGPGFRARHGIDKRTRVVAVLAGSRAGEIARHLVIFGDTIRQLHARHPDLAVLLPTLPHLQASIEKQVSNWPVRALVTTGVSEKYDAMAAADAALAVSGTVSLELSLAGVPTVIAYRMNTVSHGLLRRMVKVRFASIVNIMLDREGEKPAIPERIQQECRPEVLAGDLDRLLKGEGAEQLTRARPALEALRPPGDRPSRFAAKTVLEVIRALEFVATR